MSANDDNVLYIPGALALVLAVSRVSGVAPLHFVKVGEGYRVTISPLMSKYGYILITAINAITLSSLINDLVLDQKHSVRVTTATRRVVWVADASIMFANAFVSAFGSPSRIRCFIKSFGELQKINNELKNYKWTGTGEKKKIFFVIIWTLLTVVLCLLDHSLLITAIGNNSKQIMIVIMYSCYYYCYWVMNLIQMQFIMIALLVRSSFQSVNEQLKNIIRVKSEPVIATLSPTYFKVSAYKKRKKSINCVIDSLAITNNFKSGAAYTAVRRITDNYVAICEVMRNINNSYGTMIMLLLVSYFLHLIVTPYYLVHNLSDKKTDQNMLNRIIQFSWCCFHAFTLVMMIEPSHLTSVETENTKALVSELMRYCEPNDPISMELEVFFRQLILNQVSYSPMHITTLTRSLVATVFGSITTYLVVIMQF